MHVVFLRTTSLQLPVQLPVYLGLTTWVQVSVRGAIIYVHRSYLLLGFQEIILGVQIMWYKYQYLEFKYTTLYQYLAAHVGLLGFKYQHLYCASACLVECRICNREVSGSNLGRGYFAPRSITLAFHLREPVNE